MSASQSVAQRRTRRVILTAILCVAVSVSTLVASRWVRSPADIAASTAPPKPTLLTAQIERRVLSSTLIERGSVQAGGVTAIAVDPAGDTTVPEVAKVNIATGDRIQAGQLLVEISGRPLIALPGVLPAYRDLRPSDTGPDVRQLQTALDSLGLMSNSPTGVFDWQTKAAVDALYSKLGYQTPTTGGIDDQADQQALQDAQNAVTAARSALNDGQRADPSAARPSGQYQSLVAQLHLAEQKQQALIAATGPMLPRSEVAFVPSLPAEVVATNVSLGGQVHSPLASVSSAPLSITGRIDPADQSVVRAGMSVKIESEALGKQAVGRVTSIGNISTSSDQSSDANPATYVQIAVQPNSPLPLSWNGQDVRLTLTTASTKAPVLVVPVTSVVSDASGQTYLVLVGGSSEKQVPITIGLVADGFCQISSETEQLAPGASVVVGQQSK